MADHKQEHLHVATFDHIYITLINIQDLALRTADNEGATYVLAQDPDADRFSAAEKGYDFCSGIVVARSIATGRTENGLPLQVTSWEPCWLLKLLINTGRLECR